MASLTHAVNADNALSHLAPEAANDRYAWTLKYPESMRESLKWYGVDDKGIPELETFNYKAVELAEVCEGEHSRVWEIAFGFLHEDWRQVLEKHHGRGRWSVWTDEEVDDLIEQSQSDG